MRKVSAALGSNDLKTPTCLRDLILMMRKLRPREPWRSYLYSLLSIPEGTGEAGI